MTKPKYKEAPSRAEKQRAGIKRTQMSPELYDRVARHAEENMMSVSEVISEAMQHYVGDPIPARKRRTKSVTYWVSDLDLFVKFGRAAESAGATKTGALEAALEEII